MKRCILWLCESKEQTSPAHAASYDCDSCNRSFKSEQALGQHIESSLAHACSSMYPTHHGGVSRLLEEEGLYFIFHDVDDSAGCNREYDTNIKGWFMCRNRTCASRGWSSKRVAITIRMYPGAKYNARVYHQRCKGCNDLSRPRLDGSYAERVAYRIKKCGAALVSKLCQVRTRFDMGDFHRHIQIVL
ncbi:hypothetical protein AJ80_09796 [Polytolypa hystricis UAMH7299]|uniref:C2H2-type domain-containing protein n=1 Tax=Polytolypa hystricis (strain UAMH7299) TaxID=1447883 RepID=A0A2B7WJK8_POLH7|nr:hypothetical protein AJ80_09796 [Polytolypa hystricis UAMH7299]